MGKGVTLREIANPGPVMAIAIAVVLLQIAVAFVAPNQGAVTYAGLGLSYVLAGVGAGRQILHSTGTMRVRWMMVALGHGIGVAAFVLKLSDGGLFPAANQLAGVADVMLLLRGVPWLIAASLSNRENSPVFIRLDLAQAVLTVGLASIALLFAFPIPGGGYAPVSSLLATNRLVAANLLFAVAATVRIFSKRDSEERRFFRLLCTFLWANAIVIALTNLYLLHRLHTQPGSPVLVLSDLPVLWMAWISSRPAPAKPVPPGTTKVESFVDAGSSFLFPFSIFLMAASIVPVHLYVGMGCVMLTFILYAVRSTILQTRYLAVQEELRQAHERTKDQALLDGLTGIPNRRNFDLTLDKEWKRAQRTMQPLSLLMLDVDYFKNLNDTHGHPTGDSCLTQISSLMKARLGRGVDFVARYGGEEFAILLVDTGAEGARTVAEALRRKVEQHTFTHMGRPCPPITVSIGIAFRIPTLTDSPATLVASADKALYVAKHNGRNRVEVHAEEMVTPG